MPRDGASSLRFYRNDETRQGWAHLKLVIPLDERELDMLRAADHYEAVRMILDRFTMEDTLLTAQAKGQAVANAAEPAES